VGTVNTREISFLSMQEGTDSGSNIELVK